MNIENMLRERSQLKRSHIVWLHLCEISRIGKYTGGRLVGSRGWGLGRIGSDSLTVTGFLFGVMGMLWNQVEVVIVKHYEYIKFHFKIVNFMVRELSLNKNI